MKRMLLVTTLMLVAATAYAQTPGGDTPPNEGVCGDGIPYGDETYPTVLIGSQCWFQKNLNVGKTLEGLSGKRPTDNGTIEKYCLECEAYGGLYPWDETMQYSARPGAQGICPQGWHIPTLTELTSLKTAVGEDGKALLAVGQSNGTNTSGFSALLAGGHHGPPVGLFGSEGSITFFWSSTEADATDAYVLGLEDDGGDVILAERGKTNGFSVRCLKD